MIIYKSKIIQKKSNFLFANFLLLNLINDQFEGDFIEKIKNSSE